MPTLLTLPTLPTFELPAWPFDLPSFDVESFDLDSLELPDLPQLPTLGQVAEAARDAAFIGVGLVAMTAERVQSSAAKLADLLAAGVEQMRAADTN